MSTFLTSLERSFQHPELFSPELGLPGVLNPAFLHPARHDQSAKLLAAGNLPNIPSLANLESLTLEMSRKRFTRCDEGTEMVEKFQNRGTVVKFKYATGYDYDGEAGYSEDEWDEDDA